MSGGRRRSQLPRWLKDCVENDVDDVKPQSTTNARKPKRVSLAAKAFGHVSTFNARDRSDSLPSSPTNAETLVVTSARSRSSSADAKESTAVQVCVRIRPMNDREREAHDVFCLNTRSTESSQRLDTIQFESQGDADLPEEQRKLQSFQYDWVLSHSTTQSGVYTNLGQQLVSSVAEGFHGCAFAYGQTGSGKSHTIFGGGSSDERGLLPRIAEHIFQELKKTEKEGAFVVKASYLEIYNEKVRDLLRPPKPNEDAKNMPSLEVRQHPKVGIFVEGLTQNIAQGEEDICNLLDFGHKIRIVGATNMNTHSSRSHAVVTLHIERTILEGGRKKKRRAQLHVVDLAGSERLAMAGTGEIRQKESKHINTSLWALGLMINGLAASSEAGKGGQGHVPYRNSKLTYLLSESLMGNCKTVMLACVSPAASSLNMTEQTLRFASRAKCIKTKPTRNEELDGSLVVALRSEIEQLKKKLEMAVASDRKTDIQGQIDTMKSLHNQMSMTKEEVVAQSLAFERERGETLQSLGLSTHQMASAWVRGQSLPIKHDADPYLVNVCDDPLLSGCLTYTLELGEVLHVGSDPSCKIQIDGLGVQPEMCQIVNHDGLNIEVMMGDDESSSPTAKRAPSKNVEGGRKSRLGRRELLRKLSSELKIDKEKRAPEKASRELHAKRLVEKTQKVEDLAKQFAVRLAAKASHLFGGEPLPPEFVNLAAIIEQVHATSFDGLAGRTTDEHFELLQGQAEIAEGIAQELVPRLTAVSHAVFEGAHPPEILELQDKSKGNSDDNAKTFDDQEEISFGRRVSGLFKGGRGQVFVNNNLVASKANLRHEDRLRIGRAHVFAVFVPMELHSKGPTGGRARANTIAHELAAGCPWAEAASFLAQEYAQQLQERIGGDRAAAVLASVQEVQPLIDEANDLTDEIRGGEDWDLSFKAQILTDVTSTDDDPAVTVALYRTEKVDFDPTRSFGLETLSKKKLKSELVTVWNVPKFKLRLDAMRDVYSLVSERTDPWGRGDDPDPWGDSAVIPFADPEALVENSYSLASDIATHSASSVGASRGLGQHSDAELQAAVLAAQEEVRVQLVEEQMKHRRDLETIHHTLEVADRDRQSLRKALARNEQELANARAELARRSSETKDIEAWLYEKNSKEWEWRDVLTSLRGRLEILRDPPSPRDWMEASEVLLQDAFLCGGGPASLAPAQPLPTAQYER